MAEQLHSDAIESDDYLAHDVTVQRNMPTISSDGELIPSWVDMGTVNCRYVEKPKCIAAKMVGILAECMQTVKDWLRKVQE